MNNLDQLTIKINDLYGIAIRQGWVGRRRLEEEYNLSRSDAEKILNEIRENHLDKVLISIKDYEYLKDGDVYQFKGIDINEKDSTVFIMGSDIRSMKRDYTSGYTIDEMIRKYDLNKNFFIQLKDHLGWTHKSIPATDEELDEDLDQLTDKIIKEKKRKEVADELRKKEINELEKDAKKYRTVEYILEEYFSNIKIPNYEIKQLSSNNIMEEGSLVLNLQDLHIGKLYFDESVSVELFISKVLGGVEHILEKAKLITKLEKVYIVIGGDLCHIDNLRGTTTKGTSQEMQTSPQNMLIKVQEFLIQLITLVASVTDVELVYVKGNHDGILSLACYQFARAWFKENEFVTAKQEFDYRVYRTYGKHLYCFTHGDVTARQFKELPQIVLSDCRKLVGTTEYTKIFTGHFHHENISWDSSGTKYYQCPSASLDGSYEKSNGYVSTRGIQGVICYYDYNDDVVLNYSFE